MSYPSHYSRPPRRQVHTGGGGILPSLLVFVFIVGGAVWLANAMGLINLDNLKSPSSAGSGAGSGSGKGGSQRDSPSDSQKILAAALKYDSESYVWAGGHPPTSFRPGRGLDCSGLVNVAVMDATGIKENQVAESFRRSKHWRHVAMKDARAGDILYDLRDKGDTTDHVVIVVSNEGDGKMVVFEARTRHGPQAEQVRKSTKQKYSRFDGALRFQK